LEAIDELGVLTMGGDDFDQGSIAGDNFTGFVKANLIILLDTSFREDFDP